MSAMAFLLGSCKMKGQSTPCNPKIAENPRT